MDSTYVFWFSLAGDVALLLALCYLSWLLIPVMRKPQGNSRRLKGRERPTQSQQAKPTQKG